VRRVSSSRSIVSAHMPAAVRHLADWREELFVLVPNKPPVDPKSASEHAVQMGRVGGARGGKGVAGASTMGSAAFEEKMPDPRDGPATMRAVSADTVVEEASGGLVMGTAAPHDTLTEVAKSDYNDRAKYLCNMKRVELNYLRYSMILETVNDEGMKTGPGPDMVLPLWRSKFNRRIRLMMALTMYAEDPDELKKTLYGVAVNIDAMVSKGLLDWDQIVVTLVTDGLSRANDKTLAWMESLNMYNSDVIDWASQKWGVDKADASVHCFESTVQLAKEDDPTVYHYPLQLIFFAKQNNAGKLDSQRWFFYGLADPLMPLMKQERTEVITLDSKEREMLYLGDAAQCLDEEGRGGESKLECCYNRFSAKHVCNEPILSGTPVWYSAQAERSGDHLALHPACFNRLKTQRKRLSRAATMMKGPSPARAAKEEFGTTPVDLTASTTEVVVEDGDGGDGSDGKEAPARRLSGSGDSGEGEDLAESRDKIGELAETKAVGAEARKLLRPESEAAIQTLKTRVERGRHGQLMPYYSFAVQTGQGVPQRQPEAPGLPDDGLPEYFVQLIDVGTRPLKDAILKLYMTMKEDAQIAGCCGEIEAEDLGFLSPVVGAQNFEYKVSHVMDKAMESTFGYITVLPGAFSAYRYNAIRRDQLVPDARNKFVQHLSKSGPLVEYFKSLSPSPEAQTPFSQNMYLAEDRILCFALIAMEDKNWVLRYVKGAVATTDVPTSLVDLIKQRRRWLNGALFAMIYALSRFKLVWTQSSHSFARKLFLSFQFFYFLLGTILNWFLIGSYYITFLLVLGAVLDDSNGPEKLLRYGLTFLYLLTTTGQFLVALGNKPHEVKALYGLSSLLYGAMTVATLLMGFVSIWNGTDVPVHVILAAAMITGSVFLCAFLHGEMTKVLPVFIHYLVLIPSFINILTVYSVCRVDDVSWGTKGLETVNHGGGGPGGARMLSRKKRKELERRAKEEAKERAAIKDQKDASFRQFRSYVVMALLASNWIYVTGTFAFDNVDLYVVSLAYLVVFLLGVRVAGSVIFILLHWARNVRKMLRLPRCARVCVRKVQDKALVPCGCVRPFDEVESSVQDGVKYDQRDCCLHPTCGCFEALRCGCCRMQEQVGQPTAWMSAEKRRLEDIEFPEINTEDHVVSLAELEDDEPAAPAVDDADDATAEIRGAYEVLQNYIQERDEAAARFTKENEVWRKRAEFTRATVDALHEAIAAIDEKKATLVPEIDAPARAES